MNIVEKTNAVFKIDISKMDLYEKSKFVNIKFNTTKSNLPTKEILCDYLSIFPNRDIVKININFFDDELLCISNIKDDSRDYTELLTSYDADDFCSVNIEITKKIVDSVISVYILDEFINNIINDGISKTLTFFSNILYEQKCLHFQCLEYYDLFWKTKTLAFVGEKLCEEYCLKNRFELLNQIKENANCTTFEKYHLLPDDFKIEINYSNNKLTSLFDKLKTLLSIIYISSFSTIDSNGFNCEIIGQRNVAFFDNFDSLKPNEELYKIYEWAFSEGNVVDKLLIARNAISLHCKYVKLIDIDERTFESIKSNHQLYLRDNASKYIEAKEQISKFIIDIISQINDNISKLSGEFKDNLIAVFIFFVTVFLVNLTSEQPLDNIFTEDVTKIIEIIIICSVSYAVISIIHVNCNYKKQIKVYDNLKNNYTNILSHFEIEEIFENNETFFDAKKIYKKQMWFFSATWILCILIVFIIVECEGDNSSCKRFFDFVIKDVALAWETNNYEFLV